MGMLIRSAMVVYGVVIATAWWSNAASAQSLTVSQVEAAIEWGAHGDPQPFLLHHRPPGTSAAENRVIVGAIYTPYLRVALAAKAAHDAGRPFAPADVPDPLLDPVVYVAFRWYGGFTGGTALDDPQVAWIPYDDDPPGHSDLSSQLRPLWITRGTAILHTFGAEPPYDDVAMVAGFPAFSPGRNHEFLVSRHYLDDQGIERTFVEIGRLTAREALALGAAEHLTR